MATSPTSARPLGIGAAVLPVLLDEDALEKLDEELVLESTELELDLELLLTLDKLEIDELLLSAIPSLSQKTRLKGAYRMQIADRSSP